MLNPEHYRIRRVNRSQSSHRYLGGRAKQDALTEAAWGRRWLAAPTLLVKHPFTWSDSRNMQPMADTWSRVPPNVEYTPQEIAELTGQCLACIMEAITYRNADTGEYQPKIKGLPTCFQVLFVA